MQKLPKIYNPKETEERIYQLWEKGGYFQPQKQGKKTFTITAPPPNVTGSLHMGHALNCTIQDILIRWKRMQGFVTLWVFGTDHAGIATQNVVEKELKKEGKTRFDLGREKFIERVWEWKKKFGNIIVKQVKKLGCSCDWSRERFTMDKDYSEAVKTAFLHYYKKGYLYRGERVINWCPRCQTVLSDLELEYQEVQGSLWFIRYPPHLVVATTRPETLLGDTAVAVHPKDKRYQKLIGQKVQLPLLNREIPIIADEAVDPSFGSGAVKVTPAHDPRDFEIGLRHQLSQIKVIDEKGIITKEGGIYQGLEQETARQRILKDLQAKGFLEKEEKITHHIPHCYRCHTKIEQLSSPQWFIKMDELKKSAIRVVNEGKIRFVPARFKRVYLDWMKNVKDWCISRQIWWGHRIPIWVKKEDNQKFSVGRAKKGYRQIDDVLDTWFSSALWPFAVLGWPQKTKDLKQFYPTQVLTTAREIIFLWVARMIFSSLEFTQKIPFETVLIHPVVLSESGKRMSKSLGTGVDPIALIEKYGADATRFGIAWQLTGLQDLRFKEDTIIAARNFCNKIWNASRFVLLNTDQKTPPLKPPVPKTSSDRKILQALNRTIKETNTALEKFQFGRAAQSLYHFFWHQFCDQYIEASKKQLQEPSIRENTQQILLYLLATSLKLLHPFIPFITEEIWQKLPGIRKPLIVSEWPSLKRRSVEKTA